MTAVFVLFALLATPAGAEHDPAETTFGNPDDTSVDNTVYFDDTSVDDTVYFDDTYVDDTCDPAVYPDWANDPFCNPDLTTGTTIGSSASIDSCDPAVYPDWANDPFCNPDLTTGTTVMEPSRATGPALRTAIDDTPLTELDPTEAPDVGAGRMLLAIDAIAELGGFERATMATDAGLLRDIRDGVPADGLDEDGYADELERFVLDFVPYLEQLEASGVQVSDDLWTAALDLQDVLFSEFDPDSADPGLLDPAPWLQGLADLLVRGASSAPTPTPDVDQGAIRELLASFAEAPQPTTTTTEAPAPASIEDDPAPDSLALDTPVEQDDSFGTVLMVAALCGLVAAGAALAVVRKRRATVTPIPRDVFRSEPGHASQRSKTKMTELLDASRRMSATLDAASIASIALAEAERIADAAGGIVVRRTPDGFEALGSAPAPLFDPLQVSSSRLTRVIETGRAVAAIATDEPLILESPIATGTVPIVADGVVTGAIMVVRNYERPFDRDDLDALEMLAPLVGSALAVAREHESAKELVDVEPLTGLHNRRRLDLDLAAISAEDAVAYLMVDIDHFKNFNDTNGHAAGDEALRTVSSILKASVRPNDFVYRYGGEEFCVLLPGATAAEAADVAERARAAVEAAVIPGMENQPEGCVTISVGVSDSAFGSPGDLTERADAALYESKRNGRNRVTLSA